MNQGAGVAVVRKDGAVLLQLRTNDAPSFPGVWAIPGGHVEQGESYLETAQRELEEETGYKTSDLKLLINETYFNDLGEKVTRHIYWTKYDDIQDLKCLEGQKLQFMLPKEFENLDFVIGHKDIALKASNLVSADQV